VLRVNTKMPQRKRNNNRYRKHRKRGRRANANSVQLQRNSGPNFMPARFETTLSFCKLTSVANNGFGFANARFTPTAAYDVDPLIASTAVPGFTELAGMYRFYRVKAFSVEATFVNLDSATAALVYISLSNVDPGANSTVAQEYISNRRARVDIVGNSSGNSKSRMLKIDSSIANFGGVIWTGQLDTYSSSVTSTPTNNIFFVVGCQTTSAMTMGVAAMIYIDLSIEFFELASPAT